MPQTHIRVNRHIHDFVASSHKHFNKEKTKSDDSDHIYETLDDVSSNKKSKSKSTSLLLFRYISIGYVLKECGI